MLTDTQDAYGHAMLDHLHGEPQCEIVERDDGHIDISNGATFYFAPYKEWPASERQAIQLARGRVLDVGCGAGRCALYLQEQGHEVVGIDISPLAVEVCKQRGVRQAFPLSVTEVSRKLGLFDTIVMFGNNLGLLGSERRGRWLLRRFHALTSPDARILGETRDPYATADPDHLAYHALNRARGRMGGQVRLRVRYRRYATPWFDYLFLAREELDQLIQGTGWHIAAAIGGREGNYIAVLEKDQDL